MARTGAGTQTREKADAGCLAALFVALGTFLTCYPCGSLCTSLFARADGPAASPALQVGALLAMALVTLVFRRLGWGGEGFPRRTVRCASFCAGIAAASLLLVAPLPPDGSAQLGCALVYGASLAYPLVLLSEVPLIVYRRAGRARCMLLLVLSYLASVLLDIPLSLAQAYEGARVAVPLACIVACWWGSWSCDRRFIARATPSDLGRSAPYRMSVYTVALLVGFGVTWGLSLGLMSGASAVSEGVGTTGVVVSVGVATCLLVAVAFVRGVPNLHFGLIVRVVMALVGVFWACVPVLSQVAPAAIVPLCATVYLLEDLLIAFFSIEVARETGLRLIDVMPANYLIYSLCAAVSAGGFVALRACVGGSLAWELVALAAVVPCLGIMPLLPGRASSAGVFALSALPEDETYRSRVERARASLAARYGLTAREDEVLALLIAGRSRDEVARELSISDWTVKNHLKSLYAKLGVHSVADLVRLVSDPES